jgi:cytochrome bd-type quinol oxidase subunit 2
MISIMNLFILLGAGEALDELYGYATSLVEILSLLIGVVLVGSTIFAGIQYITAGGDSGKVQKAKGRLASNVLVLVLYIFSAAILNWILPG